MIKKINKSKTQDKPANKKVKWFILVMIILLLITTYFVMSYIKPSIILQNNTNKDVYVFTSQSEYGREPTIEELDRWKGVIVLQPNQQLKLSVLLENLLRDKVIRLDSGWRLGQLNTKTKLYNQGFVTSSKQGDCDIYINVNENGFDISSSKKSFCYKKLIPLKPEY